VPDPPVVNPRGDRESSSSRSVGSEEVCTGGVEPLRWVQSLKEADLLVLGKA
jgi:hypothetical protein